MIDYIYLFELQIKGETEEGWGEYSKVFSATTGRPYGKLTNITLKSAGSLVYINVHISLVV